MEMNNTRATSSVIGIVLMVGIVIFLAVTLGYYSYVFIDKIENPPPQAVLNADQKEGIILDNKFNDTGPDSQRNVSVIISHLNGDSIDSDHLSISVNGYPAYDVYQPDNPTWQTLARQPAQSNLNAGDSIRVVVYGEVLEEEINGEVPSFFHNPSTLKESLDSNSNQRANELNSGDTVQAIWTSPSGLTSYILFEYTVS